MEWFLVDNEQLSPWHTSEDPVERDPRVTSQVQV